MSEEEMVWVSIGMGVLFGVVALVVLLWAIARNSKAMVRNIKKDQELRVRKSKLYYEMLSKKFNKKIREYTEAAIRNIKKDGELTVRNIKKDGELTVRKIREFRKLQNQGEAKEEAQGN